MEIEELPDLKVAWHESYKCLAEPLLEYVWEVANHFLPDYAETDMGMIPVESFAPAIFANRYAERNLSIEERYERTQEMKTFKGTLEEYKKREYRKLDDSFKGFGNGFSNTLYFERRENIWQLIRFEDLSD